MLFSDILYSNYYYYLKKKRSFFLVFLVIFCHSKKKVLFSDIRFMVILFYTKLKRYFGGTITLLVDNHSVRWLHTCYVPIGFGGVRLHTNVLISYLPKTYVDGSRAIPLSTVAHTSGSMSFLFPFVLA